ncbi:MAG: 30S ribosome-binding factor RbfA [Candidatus Puniceispirillaceae bacterium]
MSRKSKAPSKAPSQRQLRVGEELRHHLSTALMRGDIYVPELEGISVTVSEVSVSPDMSNARVYVTPLGGTAIEEVVAILNVIAPDLQSWVAQKIHLRRMPRLKFMADHSFDNAQKMSSLIANLPPALSDASDEDDQDNHTPLHPPLQT